MFANCVRVGFDQLAQDILGYHTAGYHTARGAGLGNQIALMQCFVSNEIPGGFRVPWVDLYFRGRDKVCLTTCLHPAPRCMVKVGPADTTSMGTGVSAGEFPNAPKQVENT